MKYRSVILVFAFAAGLVSPQSKAELGVVDAVPAATLLLPYFEVDLNSVSGHTTLFSVNNADTAPVIAHITYWTNVGVATFSYDIMLAGLDVHTVNIRDFFASGFYSTGNFSTATLPPADLLRVNAAHTGQPDPDSDLCSGFDFGDNVARGYITIDAMNEAGAGFPFEDGYFVDGGNGKASNRNVLWGDYSYIDPQNNFAQSERMVHIEAVEIIFKGGDPLVESFYRHFVDQDGRDNRESLPSIWGAGYDQRVAESAGTDLTYWREIGGIVEPFNCGVGNPPTFPLLTNDIVAFDELENPAEVNDQGLFPLAAGTTDVASLDLSFEKGWIFLDLRLALAGKGTPTFVERQSFVLVRSYSQGRFSHAFAGTPLNSLFGK